MINTKTSQRRDASNGATLNECFDAIGFGRYQVTIFVVLAIAGFSDGMEVLVIAFLYKPLQDKWQITDFQMGVLGSLIFLGVFIGSFVGGVLGDRIGRKKVLIYASVVIGLFGSLSAIAPTFYLLLLSRLLVGFALGGVGPAAFSLATEFCPPERRGTILVLLGQMFSLGEMIESLLAWAVMTDKKEDTWRTLLGLSAIPSMISVILIWKCVPESVRFLAASGQKQELHEMLATMARGNGPDAEAALANVLGGGQIRDLPTQLESEEMGRPRDLFRGDRKFTTLVLWFIWYVQSFVYYGLTFILPLAVPIITGHKKAGIVNDNLYLTSFLAAAAELPGVALAAFVTDIQFFGRKRSLALFMGLGAIFCAMTAIGRNDYATFVIGLMFAKCMINGSFTLAWTYTAEVYPTSERTTGLGACSAMSRVGGICTPFLSTFLLHWNFFLPFALYAVVAFLGCAAALSLRVETRGKDLDDNDNAKRDEERVSLLVNAENADLMPTDMQRGSRAGPATNYNVPKKMDSQELA